MDTEKNRHWTTCSKFVGHSRLNSQHKWGDLSEQLMSSIIITLIIYKEFIQALKHMRKGLEPRFEFCQSSRTN